MEAIALLGAEDEQGPEVSVAGRIVARLMGKASFLKVLIGLVKFSPMYAGMKLEMNLAEFKKLILGISLESVVHSLGLRRGGYDSS